VTILDPKEDLPVQAQPKQTGYAQPAQEQQQEQTPQ